MTQTLGEKARAREVILRHGWNATAYQLLNPGITYWFSQTPEALVGYVSKVGVRVVAGAPVTNLEQLEKVARAFEDDAAGAGERVCYFGAESRLEALYRNRQGYAHVLLGGQPVWDPQAWVETVQAQRSLRAQLNRARNKGVLVREWPSVQAHQNSQLEELLEAWLSRKALPPLHFLVESHTLAQLTDRRVFVAQRDEKLIGFLLASPVPTRCGWLVEQIIRDQSAPNGTAELLVDTAVRAVATEGSTYLTLGLVPLAQAIGMQPTAQPFWLPPTLRLVRAHGQRFYNFAGLEYFKTKFCPQHWDPIYAISNERSFSVRSLYAIAAAFGNRSPVGLVASALGRAVRQEIVWGWQQMDRRRESKKW
jgi:phosphatidylglycerol lysyltransferase